MPVVFDNTFLALLFGPLRTPPRDPRTGAPVERAQARIESLVEDLSDAQIRILIPTPALCEFLTVAGREGAEYLAILDSTARFEIAPFDTAAAVEAARWLGAGIRAGDKRRGRAAADWQKVKVDHQIVAIAKMRLADTIYSDDGDVAKYGADVGITVIGVADLPPPPLKQADLPIDE